MLKDSIRKLAYDVGFDLVGFTRPEINDIGKERYLKWLEAGYAADMKYLHHNIEKRLNPRLIFPAVKTVISVGLNYYQRPAFDDELGKYDGRISIYAYGRDYHLVLKDKLFKLAGLIERLVERKLNFRVFVDTAPLLERQLAQQAGLGWIGNNSCLITEEFGSFVFLGELFMDLEVEPDEAHRGRCEGCNKCKEICPASAIVEDCFLDARRCISYLTIEHVGDIREEFKDKIGRWLYGCDLCQIVCPYNHSVPITSEEDFKTHILGRSIDVRRILEWDEKTLKDRVRFSPAERLTPFQWKRNASIVLDNLIRGL